VNKTLYLDSRSLGLFRITCGCVLLYDLLTRLFDVDAHLSENGVLPLEVVPMCIENHFGYYVHFLSDSFAFQVCLLIYHILITISFIIGYRTKFCNLMCWYLHCSLQERNPLVNYGADQVLVIVLFLTIFLPLDKAFSVHSKKNETTHSCGLPSALYFLQIFIIYIFAALAKNGAAWAEGRAVFNVLSLELYSNTFGRFLLNYPLLLKCLTYLTLVIESIAPVLLLFHRTRMVGVVVLFLLQFSFVLTMNLGIFPYISIVALIPFLPSSMWAKKQTFIFESVKYSKTLNFIFLFIIILIVHSSISEHFKLKQNGLNAIASFLKLEQQWDMFAPEPEKGNRWLVLAAILENGKKIDLLNGNEPVSLKKPNSLNRRCHNDRWKEYFYKLSFEENHFILKSCVLYFVNIWNKNQMVDHRVKEVQLFCLNEKIHTREPISLKTLMRLEFKQ